MKDSITYEEALRDLAHLERIAPEAGKQLKMFERSTVLALLFDVPKKKTMDDLLNIRSGGEYGRRMGR